MLGILFDQIKVKMTEFIAFAALEPWRPRLKDKRVLLYTGGVKSWSIVSALQDLGMKVVATGTKKSTEEDKARIRELMGDDTKMIDDGKLILEALAAVMVPSLSKAGRRSGILSKRALPGSSSVSNFCVPVLATISTAVISFLNQPSWAAFCARL